MTFYQHRSLGQLLIDGLKLYQAHAWTLTRPIVMPTLWLNLGAVLWIYGALGSVYVIQALSIKLPVWLFWGLFVLANIPGAVLHLRSLWEYLVWVPATSLLVRDLVETGAPMDEKAYPMRVTCRSVDFALILKVYCVLLFLPFVVMTVPLMATSGSTNPMVGTVGLWLGFLTFAAGAVISAVGMMFVAMVFQVLVFRPGSAGACVFHSAHLVKRDWLKTLGVALVVLVITQGIVPVIATFLFDLSTATHHVAQWMQPGMLWAVGQLWLYIQTAAPTEYVQILGPLSVHQGLIAIYISKACIGLFVGTTATLLSIPLGTCWFALLYGDMKANDTDTASNTMTLMPVVTANPSMPSNV